MHREVARGLIGVRELGEALVWSPSPAVAADKLWVHEQTAAADSRSCISRRAPTYPTGSRIWRTRAGSSIPDQNLIGKPSMRSLDL